MGPIGTNRIGLIRITLSWISLDWHGTNWIGIDWLGLEWVGTNRIRLGLPERVGVERIGLACRIGLAGSGLDSDGVDGNESE